LGQILVVIKKGTNSFGAYIPDLPGCVAAGETRQEVATLIQEAIEFHIKDLKAQAHQVPSAHSSSELVCVND
jgi:predicted RNase H-like HicB family nuclease